MRTDGQKQTEMKKTIFAFRNFANAPKITEFCAGKKIKSNFDLSVTHNNTTHKFYRQDIEVLNVALGGTLSNEWVSKS